MKSGRNVRGDRPAVSVEEACGNHVTRHCDVTSHLCRLLVNTVDDDVALMKSGGCGLS